jgi:hypothetical protein
LSAVLHGGILRLAFRRGLPLAFLCAYAALLVLAAAREWTPPVPLDEREEVVARGLSRAGAWSLFGLVALPWLVLAAARSGARWQRGDAEWLAPTPARALSLALSFAAGTWAAGLALAFLTALAGEAAAGAPPERSSDEPAAWRWLATLESPAVLVSEAGRSVRWEAPSLPSDVLARGARFLLRPTVAPGSGPAVTVAFSLVAGSEPIARVARRISGKSTLALDVPPGARGPLSFELAREEGGAVLVLPARSLELCVAAASERLAGVELLLRAGTFLAGALALALALGAWMRPSLAAGSVLALALLPRVIGAQSSAWPAGDLVRAWSLAGQGLVPAPPGTIAALVCAGALVAGVALLHLALRRGRASA